MMSSSLEQHVYFLSSALYHLLSFLYSCSPHLLDFLDILSLKGQYTLEIA